MAKPKTLSVYPNPFHAFDHHGHPNCVMPKEPVGHIGNPIDNREFIGAQLRHEFLTGPLPEGDARQRLQRTTFVYDDAPVTVPHTAYYRNALVSRELIAADEETASAVGMRFVDPATALEAERASACAGWKTLGHEDHDDEPPVELSEFVFGPMQKAAESAPVAPAMQPALVRVPKAAPSPVQPPSGGE